MCPEPSGSSPVVVYKFAHLKYSVTESRKLGLTFRCSKSRHDEIALRGEREDCNDYLAPARRYYGHLVHSGALRGDCTDGILPGKQVVTSWSSVVCYTACCGPSRATAYAH